MGQRFLKSLLPKAGHSDGSLEATPRELGSAALSPRIMGGHLGGEGVRTIAALLAEVAEQHEGRLPPPELLLTVAGDSSSQASEKDTEDRYLAYQKFA